MLERVVLSSVRCLTRSNRAKRGFYGGKDVRFGNTISFSHRVFVLLSLLVLLFSLCFASLYLLFFVFFPFTSSYSHRRKFKPNVHNKRLWSESLQKFVSFKVTTSALRDMDKVGGLDEYVLRIKPEDIHHKKIMTFRNTLIKSISGQK